MKSFALRLGSVSGSKSKTEKERGAIHHTHFVSAAMSES